MSETPEQPVNTRISDSEIEVNLSSNELKTHFKEFSNKNEFLEANIYE